MKNDLFNSTFEMELRVAMLLCVGEVHPFSLERILAMDFIACYAKSFGFSNSNLHGDNSFMYGELSSRRGLIKEAIGPLVYRGIVEAKVAKGYLYQITDIGKEYILSLESEYAKEYRTIAETVINELDNYSDEELMRIIQFKSDSEREGAE